MESNERKLKGSSIPECVFMSRIHFLEMDDEIIAWQEELPHGKR